MKPLIHGNCGLCGKPFKYETRAGTRRRYCSDKCQRRSAYEREMAQPNETRRCPRCGETKAISEFSAGTATYCRPCMAEYARSQYQKHKAHVIDYQHMVNLRRYGLTLESFMAMVEAQGGKCAICGRDEPGGQGKWHVDHDHSCCSTRKISCGKCIRGLLCTRCNIGIGNFGDSPEVIRAAADYLDAHAVRRAGHSPAPAV